MNKTVIVILLIVILAGIGLTAASCSALPKLWPVRADQPSATPTAFPAGGETPTVEISPAEGGPGTRITVSGRGWRAGDTVFVRLEDPATGQVPGLDQASAIITEAGDFSVKFTFPFDPRWASLPRVQITALNPARGQRAAATFVLAGIPAPTQTATNPPAVSPEPTATTPASATPAATETRPAPTATNIPPTATLRPATATPLPPTATPRPPTATPLPVIINWRGEYYANPDLAGQPVAVRDDWSVDFNWGLGSPVAAAPADGFSARWTRTVSFEPGTYRFYLTMDDAARLWVDGQMLIDAWRDGSAREVTADIPLAGGPHALRVEYYERTGLARVQLRWERLSGITYPDWKGEYWANLNLAGTPTLTRNDGILRFQWETGAPAVGLPADGFSARWTRQVSFGPGIYRLFAQADDGVRVYVDGQLVLNEWHDNSGVAPFTVDLPLSGAHTLMVEYYERSGAAFISFWWQQTLPQPTATPTSLTSTPTRTPTASATPTRTVTPLPTTVATKVATASPTATRTPTNTPTEEPTATPTVTATAEPTATRTPTNTPTEELTATRTPTNTPTEEPTATPTATATAEPTATRTPTNTPTEEPTATPTATTTAEPTATRTAAEQPTAEATATPTGTPEPAGEATATPTGVPSPLPGTRTPTPQALSVRLNELLPVPQAVDWDGDRRATPQDEWIELFNPTRRAVDVSGWSLEVVGRPAGRVFRIPRRTVIPAGGYLTFYQRQSRLALPDAGGQVRLLDARGQQVDAITYPALESDASYSYERAGVWHADWPPTPGKPNLPPAPTATTSEKPTATP